MNETNVSSDVHMRSGGGLLNVDGLQPSNAAHVVYNS